MLGTIAESNPRIVSKLHNADHEIASHGYGHRLVYNMTPVEFKEDLKRSCNILEDITGKKILGFRAPSWSVKKKTLEWFCPILEELGLKYSSSVYPEQTFLYGIPDFPQEIHYPVINGRKTNILEIPVPLVNILGKKLGFSGGFYLRIFPAWFIIRTIKKMNSKNKPVFIYLHSREIDQNQPNIKLPFTENLIHYWGIRSCESKLEKIIKSFVSTFSKISEIV